MPHIPCTQGKLDWWMLRRGMLTASAFDQIVTPAKLQPSAQRIGKIRSLIGDLARNDYDLLLESQYMSDAMKNGVMLEPEARDALSRHIKQPIKECGFYRTDCGRFGASPDGELVGSSEHICVEIKCPQPEAHLETLDAQCVPTKYRLQIQGQMMIGGYTECIFMSYRVDAEPFIAFVEPDDEVQAALRAGLEVFWQDFIETANRARKWINRPAREWLAPLAHVPAIAEMIESD